MITTADEEVEAMEALDEMSGFFNRETPPKILITTADHGSHRTIKFARDLADVIPNAKYYYRQDIQRCIHTDARTHAHRDHAHAHSEIIRARRHRDHTRARRHRNLTDTHTDTLTDTHRHTHTHTDLADTPYPHLPCTSHYILNRKGLPLKKIIKQCETHGYTELVVINEDRRIPDGLILCHLPDGPTAHFKLTSSKLSKEMTKMKRICKKFDKDIKPEVILNNFNTMLGHRVGRMLASIFHYDPDFEGEE